MSLISRGLQVSDAAAGTRRATGGYNWSSPLSLYGTQVFSAPVSHWYTVPSLAAFLRDSRVLEALLGIPAVPPPADASTQAGAAAARPTPPVHVQTLTRVPTILKFLAQVRACARRGARRGGASPVSPALHLHAPPCSTAASRRPLETHSQRRLKPGVHLLRLFSSLPAPLQTVATLAA